jgi:hypothetical protein
MKMLFSCRLFVLAALAVVGTARGAEAEMVVSPTTRQDTLEMATKLLTAKGTVAVGKDPFHTEAVDDNNAPPAGPVAAGPVPPKPPAGPHDLLQAIATSPSLKPSGYFVLGGQPTLVFGQKRVKAGSFLKITFEGTEYDLEIVSIDRLNFTLRLNREEFTRPIK